MPHLICLIFSLTTFPLMASDLAIQQSDENLNQPHKETLTGTLINKPWRKSYDSYCAGGSEYFVLQQANASTITLKYTPPKGDKTLIDFINQQIIITGHFQTESVSPSDRSAANGFISQTLSDTVFCTRFIIEHIKLNQ
ncbi:MAG TPA: hypothetical protein EYP59_00970 [Thiotrichaceae bacterium]|nr:hypothetical protein [Thiotrichaceae bacterium]